MKKQKVWIVVGKIGSIRSFESTRRLARQAAKWRNESGTWKPYRVYPAVVTWKEQHER